MKFRRSLAAVLPLALAAAAAPAAMARSITAAQTPIKHVVVIVQENHSFDSYFSEWCRQTGRCEPGPTTDPGTGIAPTPLSDPTTMAYDPNHNQSCELAEMKDGMRHYVDAQPDSAYPCGNPLNFQYAPAGDTSAVAQYQQWAGQYALAANNFQSIAGASSSNDMYLWTAKYEFTDNAVEPDAYGKQCSTNSNVQTLKDANLGDLLHKHNISYAWYAEGYGEMAAQSQNALGATTGNCPPPPVDCNAHVPSYPCDFDPSDIPAEYYTSSVDNPDHMRDYSKLQSDLNGGSLPSVVFVKARGYKSEHPGYGTKVSDGVKFVTDTYNAIEHSSYASSTLVLVAWDESGGYFDHVVPPASPDANPYGPRVPLLALGPFAAQAKVSNVQLEHSSIPKFIEWNWLGETGQLGGRDAVVNNLGSLLRSDLGVPS